MRRFSRFFLGGSLILVLLTAACGASQTAAPTLVGSTLPALENTSTPSGSETTTTETATTVTTETAMLTGSETATLSSTQNVSTEAPSAVGSSVAGTSQTPGIPVTGLDILLVECQFCVDNVAHALLVLPDTATFQVVSSTTSTTTTTTTGITIKTNCSTIEVNNGKQVVLCSGLEKTPVMLNICTTTGACTNFPMTLQACPLTQVNTAVPSTNQTQPAPGTGTDTPTPAAGATTTATEAAVTSTPTP